MLPASRMIEDRHSSCAITGNGAASTITRTSRPASIRGIGTLSRSTPSPPMRDRTSIRSMTILQGRRIVHSTATNPSVDIGRNTRDILLFLFFLARLRVVISRRSRFLFLQAATRSWARLQIQFLGALCHPGQAAVWSAALNARSKSLHLFVCLWFVHVLWPFLWAADQSRVHFRPATSWQLRAARPKK